AGAAMLMHLVPASKLVEFNREVPWIWHGLIARGYITLLTSQWKTGKTTLLSLLLAARHRGEPLAGRAVASGRTVVVSEESVELWALRQTNVDMGEAQFHL